MSKYSLINFKAKLEIIGINPFVFIPEKHLLRIFEMAKRDKGNIKIKVSVNKGQVFPQTLLRYKGDWRLYINTKMLKDSPKKIGEQLDISLELDLEERIIPIHSSLQKALELNTEANIVFQSLTPSFKKEIIRYISNLKTEESVERNVVKAIDFLLGKGDFVGRKSIVQKK